MTPDAFLAAASSSMTIAITWPYDMRQRATARDDMQPVPVALLDDGFHRVPVSERSNRARTLAGIDANDEPAPAYLGFRARGVLAR
jgi:hypothetical protein